MEAKIQAKDVDFYYGKSQALKKINMDFYAKRVTALIGPSGCGKSTFIRLLNRMNDLVPGARVEGSITLDGREINHSRTDVVELRRKVGMVFQKPNPFPKTIYENLAYGLTINGVKDKDFIEHRVIESLKKAALYEDIKDRLHDSALMLSGGQQQRLCIARCLAVEPEVILFDEPCASLDPISTRKIEELILSLKEALHDRDRDPQHAAGRARQRLHGLSLPGRADRVRADREHLYRAQTKDDRRLSLW